jgi:hypothetical protein
VALILTRLQVGNYEEWKTMFDQDVPGARRDATEHRVLRNVDDPNEVFIQIEFRSVAAARAAQERLLASGVLDRFGDRSGPTVVEVVESISHETS